MQLFLHTCNTDEVKAALNYGVLDGITTSPTLLKAEVEKSGGTFADHIKQLLSLSGKDRPVSLSIIAKTAQEMYNQAKQLQALFGTVAENLVVEIPIDTGEAAHFEGLKVIKALEDQEITVAATHIFTPEQALMAANAGATYVVPATSELDDHLRSQAQVQFTKDEYFPQDGYVPAGAEEELHDNGIVSGVDLVEKIAELFEKQEIDCNILASQVRNSRQVREIAMAGANIATIPFAVLQQMMQHPKTIANVQAMEAVPGYQSLFGGQPNAQVQPTPQPISPQPAQPQSSPQPVPESSPQPAPVPQTPVQPEQPTPQTPGAPQNQQF